MKRHSLYMLLGLLMFIVAGCAGGVGAIQGPQVVILQVSDLHSQLVEDSEGLGGYARLMTLIEDERQKAGPHTDVIVAISGDVFGKGRLPCRRTNESGCAPLVGLLKPDVVSFGNGELKLGQSDLQTLATQTGGVWIGTNIEPSKKTKAPFWKKSFTYQGVKSGFKLSFVSSTVFPGPGEAQAGSQLDFVESSQPLVLNDNSTIVMVHDDVARLDEIGKSLCSAQAKHKPLLVLKGHEHQVAQGKRDCLTYVEPGYFGRNVARIVLTGSGDQVTVKKVDMISVDKKILDNPVMNARIEALYKSSGQGARRVVLNTKGEWSEAKVAKFLAIAYQKTSKADIAIVNSGAIKTTLPKGNVDWDSVLTAVPYNNNLFGLDWNAADLEKSLCKAAKRDKDHYLDNGSDLTLAGAELKDAGKSTCHLVVVGGKKVPKIVVDSYMVARSARWLGRELKGQGFSYGLDTERALELGIERYGKTEF